MSAGPFTMQPGSVNYVTMGVVWARDSTGPGLSLAKLREADDEAQALFGNCFDEVGINETALKINSVNIYPIPFITYTQLSFENKNHKKHSVQIFDISGRKVGSFENITSENITIEKGSLKPGIYFVKLSRLDDNVFISKKIVIE